jgi:AAA domain/RepB DNA-primase from phage plasmid
MTVLANEGAIRGFLEAVWRAQHLESGVYACLACKAFSEDGKWHEFEPQHPSALEVQTTKDLYFAPRLFSSPLRQEKHALPTRWLYADLDEVDPHSLSADLSPTIAWETSPGRYQAMWRIDRPVDGTEFRSLNRDLTYAVGADKGGWGASKVLRVPGSLSFKYGEPVRVTLLKGFKSLKRRHSVDDLRLTLQTQLDDDPEPGPPKVHADAHLVRARNEHRLTSRVLALLDNEFEKGEVSDRLWELQWLLATAQVSPEDAFVLAKAAKCNKFDGRPDEETRLWAEVLAVRRSDQNVDLDDVEPTRGDVRDAVRRILATNEARRIVSAKGRIPFPLPSATRTLADDLAVPPQSNPFVIERLHPAGGNVLLTAGFKVGKTTLMMNLIKALADDLPFLGVFDTKLVGRVAYVNYEVGAEMARAWLRSVGIENLDRVASPLHTRGFGLPFWESDELARLADWLGENGVQYLLLDPAASAWRPLVESENDNSQVAAFTEAIDVLKERSGVSEVVLSAHTGRAHQVAGQERSRGATRLEDWMDVGWYLSKSKDTRAFRASGRDVDIKRSFLEFEPSSRCLRLGGATPSDSGSPDGLAGALAALSALEAKHGGPVKSTEWRESKDFAGEKARRSALMKQAVAEGYVSVENGAPNNAKLHKLTKKGRKYLSDSEVTTQ